MSAATLWKNYKLDDVINRMIYQRFPEGNKIVCNNAKMVIESTNMFTNDQYTLPQSVDVHIRELYPILHRIKSESKSLSVQELGNMAHSLDTIRSAPTDIHGTFDMDCKTPMHNYDTFTNIEDKGEYNIEEFRSMDCHGGNMFGYTNTNGSPSSDSIYKLDFNTPIFRDGPQYIGAGGYTGEMQKYDPSDFDFKDEFLTAFQPGNEYHNDYTTLETPVANTSKINDNFNSDTLVSSFAWEQKLNQNTKVSATPNNLFSNTGYFDNKPNTISDSVNRPGNLWNESDSFNFRSNFNPDSPIRSIKNDLDIRFPYVSTPTPQRSYFNG